MSHLASAQLEIMLERNELKAEELTMNWMDKWTKQNELQSTTSDSNINSPLLRRLSSGFKVQLELPYLVSLNSDPLSCEILIYSIKPGETVLGSDGNISEIGKFNSNFEIENLSI